VKIDDGRGIDDCLHVIVEISGQEKADKQAKVDTASKTWIPAVNALGTAGRWAYVELREVDRMIADLKKFLNALPKAK
jgi:type III restriction enzyme